MHGLPNPCYADPRELLGMSVPALERACPVLGLGVARTFTMAPVISLHLVTEVCLCLPWLVWLGRGLGAAAVIAKPQHTKVLGMGWGGRTGKLTGIYCPLLQKVKAPLFCDLQKRFQPVSSRLQGVQHRHRGSCLCYPRNWNVLQ